MTDDTSPDPAHVARIIHRALLFGLSLIAAVFLFLLYGMHTAPLIQGGEDVTMIGNVLAVGGLLPMVFALLVLKPRIASRSSSQSPADYWRGATQSVLMLWAVFEGGGIIAALGVLLTGGMAPIVVLGLSLTGFLMVGPRHFEEG